MVKVARLPRQPLGLVCISDLFAERVQKSLQIAGLDFPEMHVVTSRRRDDVAKVLDKVDAVLVSPGRRRDVERLLSRQMEIIEFIYRPDEGSVNMLRSALVDKKEARLA
jgi:GntR family transcriptional regulator